VNYYANSLGYFFLYRISTPLFTLETRGTDLAVKFGGVLGQQEAWDYCNGRPLIIKCLSVFCNRKDADDVAAFLIYGKWFTEEEVYSFQ
jgi:hypothetical protein